MKGLKVVCILLLFGVLLGACGSSPSAKTDLTGITSYYVRSDGNDKNAGTSEDKPFGTLAKALEAASKTPVKKITIIGKLVENVDTKHLKPVIFSSRKIGDNTTIPEEILITGKPDASADEKAVLTSKTTETRALEILNEAIRLENIEISGCQCAGAVVSVAGGVLTLAKGTKITNNKGDNGAGVFVAAGSLLIMRDDAEVSYNEGNYNAGLRFFMGSYGILRDNALVSNNKAAHNGGGIGVGDSTLIIKDNATVSNNSAGDVGGGIVIFTPSEKSASQVTILNNAGVINNNAGEAGGGIFVNAGGKLSLQDTARLTGNTASKAGGGVARAESATVTKGPNVIVADNKAPLGADIITVSDQ